MKTKLLFITNKRSIPYCFTNELGKNIKSETKLSSGLVNSIKFVVSMLNHEGIESSYIQVVDGNEIDFWVTKEKPSHVMIEAIWVTPSKIKELTKIHKNVKWFIRLHSETPFLANEGVAFEWLFQYIKIPNVYISANSKRIVEELTKVMNTKVIYLPNYYKVNNEEKRTESLKKLKEINIGCFGAIRPMKNQLIQAISAINFGMETNKKILFHINVNREETGGNSVLKNIRNLFLNTDNVLIEHPWTDHESFIKIINNMNIGMQVSFSESYNIVTADFVNANIPIVVSEEIKFIDNSCKASPTSSNDIVNKLKFISSKNILHKLTAKNKELLKQNGKESIKEWLTFFEKTTVN